MTDLASQIKDKLDLADFLKNYLNLSPAGKNFKANCPFHKEKTPSFIVSPERQIWHCFGCSSGGDVIGFLMRYENIEFIEALKILAEKVGLDFRQHGSADQKQYDKLYEINQAAKDFYKANLASFDNVKNYLISDRGLSSGTIEEFELGFALDQPDSLACHLMKMGYVVAELEKAGLIFRTERGTYYDRFRKREMFPIHNHFGKIVGFTGRILPAEQFPSENFSASNQEAAKYINSPESPIYSKSRLLFGFHRSKNAIREAKQAILVEGQMDFLMCWQSGVSNIAAVSGTALTGEHLKVLKRFADTLVLAFDSDEAGQLASERTIDMAMSLDFSIKVFTIPDKNFKDPADVAKSNPDLLKRYLQSAQPVMRYYFDRYLPKGDSDAAEQKNRVRKILAKVKNIYSPIERSYWIKELSLKTGIEERPLMEELGILKTESVSRRAEEQKSFAQPPEGRLERRDSISQRLLSLVETNEEFLREISNGRQYLPETYRQILAAMESRDLGNVSPDLQNLITIIKLQSSLNTQESAEKIGQEFKELLKQLRLEHLRDRQKELSAIIMNAEQKGDGQTLVSAMKEFDFVSRELQTNN